ncbi:MAG: hypothetical protein IKA17_09445 [Clostridia bacterium]|nr:hypothetical protein [Clostridia bacterium]
MKKHKKLYAIVILFVIIILMFLINEIKIFSVTPQDKDYVYELLKSKHDKEDVDICVLDYDYVTGASWRVEKSTNKDIENKYVCINAICSPRDLKINKEFELDFKGKYVAVIEKKITETKIDNEKVELLKTEDIVITNLYYQNDGFGVLRFGDLTFAGKLKAIAALFVSKFRIQT